MTPIDLTQCPPPEGWPAWERDNDFANSFVLRGGGGAVYLRQPTGLPSGQWQLCAEKGDDCIVIYTTLADLPSAYRRALQAVGLVSPWTSEVPTTPGLYVVSEPDWDIALYEFDASDNSWRLARGGNWVQDKMFDPGTLFMPCPQPPKEK